MRACASAGHNFTDELITDRQRTITIATMLCSKSTAVLALLALGAPRAAAFNAGADPPRADPSVAASARVDAPARTPAPGAPDLPDLPALLRDFLAGLGGGSPPNPDDPRANLAALPMPPKWPVVGTLPDFLARGGVDSLSAIHEGMYREFGPMYRMSILGNDEVVLTDPRMLDQVLKREGKFPVGGAEGVTTFKDYYVDNDMNYALKSVGRGPEWKEWRQAVNRDMYVMWDEYLPAIAETCAKVSAVAGREVTEAKTLHISEFLSRAAFDMFSTVLHGESPDTCDTTKATEEDVAFVRATKKAFDATGALLADPMAKAMGSDLYKDFVVNMDQTVSLANRKAGDRIKDAQELQEKADAGASGCPVAAVQGAVGKVRDQVIPTNFANPSFIERLVDRGQLAPGLISEVQAPLLMAGVDTTAYVMSWFYLNMASNPAVQAKLARELDDALGGADVTTAEQMQSLTYLNACIRESHRLTPPAPVAAKTLEVDVDVTDKDGTTYTIPAGQRISLNLKALPIDPAYVDDPMSFVPERFLPDAVAAREGTASEIALDHPWMNDPFGRGKRKCLGGNVAIAEMTALAARLLQDWEISLVDPKEAMGSPDKTWKTVQKLMLKADPYPAMQFTPRRKQ